MGWATKKSWFFSRQGQEIFLFSKQFRQALKIGQRDAHLVSEALSQRIKRSGREADNSHASRVEVKNWWTWKSFHSYSFVESTDETLI